MSKIINYNHAYLDLPVEGVDLILKSLELFYFNINHCWCSNYFKSSDDMICLVYHLYFIILEQYKGQYSSTNRIELPSNLKKKFKEKDFDKIFFA